MRYRLVVLTHGPDLTLSRTLDSFAEHVSPAPAEAVLHCDGAVGSGSGYDVALRHGGWPWTISESFAQRGFCRASREAWQDARQPGVDHVFWLEHDFVFGQPVDLRRMADVLDQRPWLAQMALCRGPANVEEHAAGGLVAARPGTFEQQLAERGDGGEDAWLEHNAFWTTNPSLFPRSLAERFDWPTDDRCEGLFSIRLREAGLRFGLWGRGEEWVAHTGQRSGFGY